MPQRPPLPKPPAGSLNSNCANAASLQEGQRDRLIEVEWDSDLSGGIFVASIEVRSLDRPGLLGDVSGVLAEHKVNIIACARSCTCMSASSSAVVTAEFAIGVAPLGVSTHQASAVRRIVVVMSGLLSTGR